MRWVCKLGMAAALMLGLAGCYEDAIAPLADEGAVGTAGPVPDLVTRAASGDAAALDTALEAAGRDAVAALRYGPAENGLAHAAVGNTANPDAVAQVAAAGADVNLVDANGRTPLHFAIEMQSEAALRQLLANGADAEIATGLGQSPLAFCQDALKSVPDYQICQVLVQAVP